MEHIQQIYDQFRIVPILRTHMKRVTAVGKALCAHRTGPEINMQRITDVLLVHDLGNILKFDFSIYPEVFEPEGVDYRRGVQEWTRQFGSTEVEATLAMARQVITDSSTLQLLEDLVLHPLTHSVDSPNYELKICDFADMCVTPFKICHRSERIDQAIPRMTKGMCSRDAEKNIRLRREITATLDMQVMQYVDCSLERILLDLIICI